MSCSVLSAGVQQNPQCLEKGPTPSLVKYAKRGHYVKLVEALDKGGDANSVDSHLRSALYYAALNGYKKCVKELLRRGANPNQ